MSVDGDMLRRMLLDSDHRIDLFPGHATELRSKPTAKAPRIGIGPGVAIFGVDDDGDERVKLNVQHEKPPNHESVEEWRFYWTEWLDALDPATGPGRAAGQPE